MPQIPAENLVNALRAAYAVVRVSSPRTVRVLFALVSALPAFSKALEVRGYSAAQDNRLLDFPGEPIYPQTPRVNTGFVHAPAGGFLGIGWPAHPTDWTRQMALISPRHFIYATHYPLGADWNIAFLGTDDRQHLYQIESQVPVINNLGQTTDLMLCTLAQEVETSTGITPFPVLNLPSESEYLGKPMVVCGGFVRAGTTPLAGFINLVNDPGFDTTRFAYFDYNHDTGNLRECDYQGGDSGAPAFIMDGTNPAIIGIASGRDPEGWGGLPPNVSRNYIAFMPAYLLQLDSLMEAKGFHMIRSRPEAATLQLQPFSGPTLKRLKPGSLTVSLNNTGNTTAHNISLVAQSDHVPTAIESAMINDQPNASSWRCRRGGLAGHTQTLVTFNWSSMPNTGNLHVSAILNFDGNAAIPFDLDLPLLETYASWSSGLSISATSADPDHDGISNLLEYSLGGAPDQASQLSSNGATLAPRIQISGNQIQFVYRHRIDAAARGLTYQVETTDNPAGGSWSTTLPAGNTIHISPLVPPSAEFEQVIVSIPASSERRFFRLKTSLAE